MINPKLDDPYYKEKNACNEFISYLATKGFNDIPSGDLAKALSVVWSGADK